MNRTKKKLTTKNYLTFSFTKEINSKIIQNKKKSSQFGLKNTLDVKLEKIFGKSHRRSQILKTLGQLPNVSQI